MALFAWLLARDCLPLKTSLNSYDLVVLFDLFMRRLRLVYDVQWLVYDSWWPEMSLCQWPGGNLSLAFDTTTEHHRQPVGDWFATIYNLFITIVCLNILYSRRNSTWWRDQTHWRLLHNGSRIHKTWPQLHFCLSDHEVLFWSWLTLFLNRLIDWVRLNVYKTL